MKTPEEIKRGVKHCANGLPCEDCVYGDECEWSNDPMLLDTHVYIMQLEQMRDAAQLNASSAIRELAEVRLECMKQIQTILAQVPKWTNVEERLPEPETEVLVWCGKFVRMACYGYTKSGGLIFWDYDCEGYQDELYPRVTHWMPLPEGPKER